MQAKIQLMWLSCCVIPREDFFTFFIISLQESRKIKKIVVSCFNLTNKTIVKASCSSHKTGHRIWMMTCHFWLPTDSLCHRRLLSCLNRTIGIFIKRKIYLTHLEKRTYIYVLSLARTNAGRQEQKNKPCKLENIKIPLENKMEMPKKN